MNRIALLIGRYMYAMLCTIYLFSIGLFYSRHRSLLSSIYWHFRNTQRWGKESDISRAIPTIGLPELVKANASVQLREPFGVEGNPSLLEIVIINELIRANDPQKIFEIGTFNGRTTLNMAANCSPASKVYTLDLPENLAEFTSENVGSRYKGTDCEHKIVQLYGNSLTFDFSSFLDSMDFIFIDAWHSYDNVLNDSKKALEMLRNRQGTILWHNYGSTWEGVVRALNELYLEGDEYKDLRHIEGTTLACLIIR